MTVKVEIDAEQVEEAVRQYAERMMPPGWFEFEDVKAAAAEGFVVSFKPIERPPVAPEVYDGPRELPQPGEVNEPARGDLGNDYVEVGSNGVFIRV